MKVLFYNSVAEFLSKNSGSSSGGTDTDDTPTFGPYTTETKTITFTDDSLLSGKFYHKNGGDAGSSATYNLGFYPAKFIKSLSYSKGGVNDNACGAFVDGIGGLISYVGQAEGNTTTSGNVSVPSNATYFAYSLASTGSVEMEVYVHSKTRKTYDDCAIKGKGIIGSMSEETEYISDNEYMGITDYINVNSFFFIEVFNRDNNGAISMYDANKNFLGVHTISTRLWNSDMKKLNKFPISPILLSGTKYIRVTLRNDNGSYVDLWS